MTHIDDIGGTDLLNEISGSSPDTEFPSSGRGSIVLITGNVGEVVAIGFVLSPQSVKFLSSVPSVESEKCMSDGEADSE